MQEGSLQEHSVQLEQNNLRTSGEQASDSGMAQRTHLRTSIKHPNRARQQMWEGETVFRIRKGTTLPRHCSNSLQQRQPEGHTTSNSVQSNHQQIRSQQRHTSPEVQLDKDFHIVQKYILEETTGTEKASTGRGILHANRKLPCSFGFGWNKGWIRVGEGMFGNGHVLPDPAAYSAFSARRTNIENQATVPPCNHIFWEE